MDIFFKKDLILLPVYLSAIYLYQYRVMNVYFILWFIIQCLITWASPHGSVVKNPQEMQETWVWSLGMATHSSILAWRIPWTERTGGLQSTGLQRVGYHWSDWACRLTLHYLFYCLHFLLLWLLGFFKLLLCPFGNYPLPPFVGAFFFFFFTFYNHKALQAHLVFPRLNPRISHIWCI